MIQIDRYDHEYKYQRERERDVPECMQIYPLVYVYANIHSFIDIDVGWIDRVVCTTRHLGAQL